MLSTKTTGKQAVHFNYHYSFTYCTIYATDATGMLTTTGNKLEIHYYMTAENLRHNL
jgi:hypothetical protein